MARKILISYLLNKTNYWRIIEPIILGSAANIVVNYIFDPKNPDFVLNEFFVAFLFAFIVTEVNRKISMTLEDRFSWTHHFSKRFFSI